MHTSQLKFYGFFRVFYCHSKINVFQSNSALYNLKKFFLTLAAAAVCAVSSAYDTHTHTVLEVMRRIRQHTSAYVLRVMSRTSGCYCGELACL